MEKLFLSMKYMEHVFVTNNKYSYHIKLTLKALHNHNLTSSLLLHEDSHVPKDNTVIIAFKKH